MTLFHLERERLGCPFSHTERLATDDYTPRPGPLPIL